jgi:hypothetical protein
VHLHVLTPQSQVSSAMNARKLSLFRILHETYGGERGQQASLTVRAKDRVDAVKTARERLLPELEITGVYRVKSDRNF